MNTIRTSFMLARAPQYVLCTVPNCIEIESAYRCNRPLSLDKLLGFLLNNDMFISTTGFEIRYMHTLTHMSIV